MASIGLFDQDLLTANNKYIPNLEMMKVYLFFSAMTKKKKILKNFMI